MKSWVRHLYSLPACTADWLQHALSSALRGAFSLAGGGLLLWSAGCGAQTPPGTLDLAFHDAPVSVVLQALADHQQLNLVLAPGVEGNLTLRLNDVPWQQALDVVLKMGNLVQNREKNVLMIFPQTYQDEQQQQQRARQKQQADDHPLSTLSITLENAEAAGVAASLNAQRATLLSPRGSIVTDTRTNTLLIHDTEEKLAALEQWITELDQPLQQVQLTAHIVTISNESLRELGVTWGLAEAEGAAGSFRLNNFAVGLPVADSTATAGFTLARIDSRLLSLELSALEQENQVEIIASPRLLTAHLQTASIKQGTEIPYQVSNGDSGANSIEFKEAVLGMEVTPKVLSNGRIQLALQISQNMPGRSIQQAEGEALAIDKQEIKTQVTVADGETVVLGGIFQQHHENTQDNVPGLASIPWVGSLFTHDRKKHRQHQLVIFVTPALVSAS
ncbi:type IV pilus secretin PilQ [Chimaeribacter arupi]|nr:DNA uptake porin HofQ [Chimaeribacter arupi]PLR50332.1 type IV pilus secretin PilQ [Chimaeribacter arupi]